MADTITESLALRSTITSQGRLELAIAHIAVPAPTGDQVVVRVEAAPINPSDMGMLVASADLSTAVTSSGDGDLKLFASVPNAHVFAGRLDQAMPVGNEGAGTVVAGGPGAEFLIGTKVAMFGGAMYAQNRVIDVADCILLPDDVSAADGAAMFINPLTALAVAACNRPTFCSRTARFSAHINRQWARDPLHALCQCARHHCRVVGRGRVWRNSR